MVLASHQPNFFPYMGFFYKMLRSDVFVLSNDVLFSRSEFQNYTNIKTANGKQRVTVPVTSHSIAIKDIEICQDGKWQKNMIRTIEQNYRKAPFYNKYHDKVIRIIEGDFRYLYELNLQSILLIKTEFNLEAKIIIADTLFPQGRKDSRILDICNKVGADIYYSGKGAEAYHDARNFIKKGIVLEYTDYSPTAYSQLYGDFVENLSCLDYLFNCGEKLPKGWCRNGK